MHSQPPTGKYLSYSGVVAYNYELMLISSITEATYEMIINRRSMPYVTFTRLYNVFNYFPAQNSERTGQPISEHYCNLVVNVSTKETGL